MLHLGRRVFVAIQSDNFYTEFLIVIGSSSITLCKLEKFQKRKTII